MEFEFECDTFKTANIFFSPVFDAISSSKPFGFETNERLVEHVNSVPFIFVAVNL